MNLHLRSAVVLALLGLFAFAPGHALARPCTPTTCGALGATCGSAPDGCNGTLSCGVCPAGQSCVSNVCKTCSTCASLGATCGTNLSDNCGGTLASCGPNGGACAAGTACNASHQCVACTPTTCGALGATCGTPSDGCGGTLSCGSCLNPQVCSAANQCVTSTTCFVPGQLDPVSHSASFPAGSLIFPMDQCYNASGSDIARTLSGNAGTCGSGPTYAGTGGVGCYAAYGTGDILKPFGVVYLLASNNIPVSVVLRNNKVGLADDDFSITPPAGSAASVPPASHLTAGAVYSVDATGINCGVGCGTATMHYGGMPFIVDASFASQALAVLGQYQATFSAVPVHVANYAFTAPVLSVIGSRPKPVWLDANLSAYFTDTGIPAVVPNGSYAVNVTSQAAPSCTFTWPAALTPPAACPGGACSVFTTPSGTPTSKIIDVIWNVDPIMNGCTDMPNFLKLGGTVLAIEGIIPWEAGADNKLGGAITGQSRGAQLAPFCAAEVNLGGGYTDAGWPDNPALFPASNRFLQLGALDFKIFGNGNAATGDGQTSYAPTAAGIVPGVAAITNGSAYQVMAGHPSVAGTQVPGNLVYIGGLKSWNNGATGGRHVFYNTLLAGGGGGTCANNPLFTGTELTRSSPVTANLTFQSTVQALAYTGSFDWRIPKDNTQTGATLYQADPTVYPFATGHFRQYKANGTFIVDASTDYLNCTADVNNVPNHSACNWDTQTQVLAATSASRNIFVTVPSNGPSGPPWKMVKLSSLATSNPTNAAGYIQQQLRAGVLGGIDYSTAAVIENRPQGSVKLGNARTRPTIAYVGGRDGMLHAFCVTGASPSQSPGTPCYTSYQPGDEIFAVIPPGMYKEIQNAYNGGVNMDWSRVNVGGVMRVFDAKDKFEGIAQPDDRTVLLFGQHDTGYLDALDISDPNPANYAVTPNYGFAFLWEADGTGAPASVLGTMGATQGASMSQVVLSGSQTTYLAVVSSSTCFGKAGCPAAVKPGVNTYLLNVVDGSIVDAKQRFYSRVSSALGNPAIVNDVPALATTLDAGSDGKPQGDGTDESIFVAGLDGVVAKYVLNTTALPSAIPTGFDSAKSVSVFFDANTASGTCGNNVACQPVGASPSIVYNPTVTPHFGVLVASGGADWARATTDVAGTGATKNLSYVFGFDAQAASAPSAYLSRALGGITPPASLAAGAGSPGVAPTPIALRSYAQPTIAGSDLYADVTSVSLNNISQLVQPSITPGTWGTVWVWHNIVKGNQADTVASYATGFSSSTVYAGGLGAAVESGAAGGAAASTQLFVVGATGVTSVSQAVPLASSLSNSSYSIVRATGGGGGGGTGTTRPFTVLGWFDLID